MGTILTAISTHWFLILCTLGVNFVIWIAGYLRGYRDGERDEQRDKFGSLASLERCCSQLRSKINFLQAENDAWQRRYRKLEYQLFVALEWAPGGLSNTASQLASTQKQQLHGVDRRLYENQQNQQTNKKEPL